MPVLLALDTATQTASIALYDWQLHTESHPQNAGQPQSSEDSTAAIHLQAINTDTARLLAEWTWAARRRQTQDLTAAVQSLLAQAGHAARDLTALAVTTGPGSFTGVRIAASTAKGMGLGLPHPVAAIGLPVLSVTAAPWLAAAQSAGVQVWAYLQAGRGRFNWCIFEPGATKYAAANPNSSPEMQYLLWRPGASDHHSGRLEDLVDALAACPAPVWLVGETTSTLLAAVHKLSPTMQHVTAIDGVSGARRAGNLARLAALHLAHGNRDELAELQPLYLNQP